MGTEIERLELDRMDPELARYLAPRVARLGYLGELFKVGAHCPGVTLAFMHFTDALKSALPDRLTETAVLTTATLMENAYERHQHERLSVRLGYGRDWVAAVEALDPANAPLLSDVERAVQRYVIASVETRGRRCREEFDAMLAHLSAGEAVAVAMLVGRYVTHALVVNTLGLAPPVPSIFEDGFTGDGAPAKDARPPRPDAA